MGNIAAYLAVIVVGALVTLIANRPARAISLRVGYVALPDERKVTVRRPRTAAVAPCWWAFVSPCSSPF